MFKKKECFKCKQPATRWFMRDYGREKIYLCDKHWDELEEWRFNTTGYKYKTENVDTFTINGTRFIREDLISKEGKKDDNS